MPSLPDKVLSELKARQDIHDVLARYCRGADRCDSALMKSCFHDGAVDEHGFFNGEASEFAELAAVRLRNQFVSTKHYMTNELVQMNGNGTADCETYILAVLRAVEANKAVDITISARYLDRFECRNDEWKIIHRVLVSDGTRVDPVQGEAAHLNQGRPGGRHMEDPGYGFFRCAAR